MLTDRDIIINLAVDYCDGEGDYLLPDPDDFHVGEDDE